ncbi:MAG: hypothetical protein ACREXM_00485 [Gammaproteobacteria bacterium]
MRLLLRPSTRAYRGLLDFAFGSPCLVVGKMARTFLKAIRVKSREELKQRILQGVREMNLAPVVVRWTKFDLGLA